MIVNILSPDDDVTQIEGFTVVVDVFRAFSTSYYIHSNNPVRYILTDSISEAKDLKSSIDNSLLIGERNGIKIEGFDYGNSPTEIMEQDFTKQTIIHTTSAGTKGLIKQPINNEVIVGSFVNVKAIIDYIYTNKIEKVNIYCTAKKDSLYGEEDYLFAEYLRSKLLNKNISFEDIVVRLRNSSGKGFKKDGFAPYTDFLFCMDIDRFNYILKRKTTDKSIELVKI